MRFAIWLVIAAACGDSLESAPAPDAMIQDASTDGIVRIEVRSDPKQGVEVFFQNRDSTLVLATRTDADGRANALMEPGGFVTAVIDTTMMTYADVEPGDELVFERFTTATDALTSLRVQVPSETNATSYRLYSSCGTREIFGAQIQALDISLGACGEEADMLAAVSLPSGAERTIFRDDVSIGPNTLVTFAPPYMPERVATVMATAVPPDVPLLLASIALVRGPVFLFPPRTTAIGVTGNEGTATVTMPIPDGATASIHLQRTQGTDPSVFHVVQWQSASTAITVPYGGDNVRSYRTRPDFDADAQQIAWEEELDGEIADGVLVQLHWMDVNLVPRDWWVLAPRTPLPEVALPVIPDPRLTPVEASTTVLRLDNFAWDGGYARAKRGFRLGVVLDPGMWFLDEPAGRVVYRALD